MCSHQCLLRAIYHYAMEIYFLVFNTFVELTHFSNTFYDLIYCYFLVYISSKRGLIMMLQ
jgi:hypothetical protein